jgi:hypothetical protein
MKMTNAGKYVEDSGAVKSMCLTFMAVSEEDKPSSEFTTA